MRLLPVLLCTCGLVCAEDPTLDDLLKEKAPAETEAAADAKAEAGRQARTAAERQKAIGEELETLKSKKGRTYNKVVITGIDDVGIKFRHEAGLARLKFEDLPASMQNRFGFDPARAKAQQEAEKQTELERERRIIESLKARKSNEADKGKSPRSSSRRSSSRSTSRQDLKPEVLEKITLYEGKIKSLERGIEKVQTEIDSLRDRARETRADAQYTEEVRGRDGSVRTETRTNSSKMRRAESYEKRADREYEKIQQARDLIERYEDAIEALERDGEK